MPVAYSKLEGMALSLLDWLENAKTFKALPITDSDVCQPELNDLWACAHGRELSCVFAKPR